ncbi:MAG: PTS transporter subunit IIC [Christensenellales bacterium]|jgi:uncharacterized membrane protein
MSKNVTKMDLKEDKTIWGFIKRAARRYFLDALSAMALGLFASLLIGTILEQIAKIFGLDVLISIAEVAKNGYVVGAAIGVAIARALKVAPLAIFTAAVTGAAGYMGGGGPVGAYVAAVVGAEFGNLVAGKTKVDIILVPLVALVTGGLVGIFLGPPLDAFMKWLGVLIGQATLLAPIPMGIIVSVAMGLILTAPISSAALAAMIFTDATAPGVALAAGAATVGCCAQMVGFAVSSWRENKMGGLLAQGLGTSMLQVANILRHPLILIPPTLASAILGPLSTTLFGMTNLGVAAGMGTCGLVGQIGTFTFMGATEDFTTILIKVLLLHIILPAVLSLLFSEAMRKKGWIKFGDMKLEL